MALAIVLLVLALPLTLSGYATYQKWGDVFGGELFAELQETLGNALLALVLLLAVLAFGSWRWQTIPGGLLPSAASATSEHGDLDDDD